MATRRPSIPAVPTVVGATDDASRGGLFSRSNLANPVSGADVNGVPIQDSTITFTINGEPFTGNSFTLNQDTDQTINFVVSGTGGGTADGNNFVTGGSITNGILTLERDGLDDITVSGQIIGDVQANTLAATINGVIGQASIHALADTPTTIGTAGQVLTVNTAGDALVYATPDPGTVNLGSFENSDTVQFSEGDTDSSDIQATATPTWTGNTNRGGLPGSVQVTELRVANGSGLIIRAVDASMGIYELTNPQDPPDTPDERVRLSAPPPDVFTAPTPPVVEIEIMNGMADGTSSTEIPGLVSSISRNGQGIAGASAPTVMVNTERNMVTLTFAADDVDEEGDYTIDVMTPVIPSGGGPAELIPAPTQSFNRIVPFFQSRTQITATNINDDSVVTDTGEEWDGAFNTIAGSGTLYFTVRTSDFAFTDVTRGFFTIPSVFGGSGNFGTIGGTFSVNDHNGDPITFQTYRTGNIGNNILINNFRRTR